MRQDMAGDPSMGTICEGRGLGPPPRTDAARPTDRETTDHDGPREATGQAKDADNESRRCSRDDQHITSSQPTTITTTTTTTTANAARGANDSSTRDWPVEGDDGTGQGKIRPIGVMIWVSDLMELRVG